jgi:hypothetical protein
MHTIETGKKTRRRIQIEVETHEITVFRPGEAHEMQYCQSCRTSVLGFAPERLAEILRQSVDEIREQINTKVFHFVSRSGGAPICANSLNGTNQADAHII